MLDVISTNEELGKPIGSDAQEQKTTFMSLYGLEQCEREVRTLTEQAVQAVGSVFSNAEFLQQLARSLETRRN
jgi:geranylgeranyl diphosphate synthase type II